MPYIITTITYPSHKRNEVIKKYLEIMPKYPVDESLGEIVAQAVTRTNNGIKIMSIFEVKEGKFEEASTRVNTIQYEFIDIEGYEYESRVWSTLSEAFEIAGIHVPE